MPHVTPCCSSSVCEKILSSAPPTDERAACEFFEWARWSGIPSCAFCGSEDVYTIKRRGSDERTDHFRWRCRACRKLYTVRSGGFLGDSRLSYKRTWELFRAALEVGPSKLAEEYRERTGVTRSQSVAAAQYAIGMLELQEGHAKRGWGAGRAMACWGGALALAVLIAVLPEVSSRDVHAVAPRELVSGWTHQGSERTVASEREPGESEMGHMRRHRELMRAAQMLWPPD